MSRRAPRPLAERARAARGDARAARRMLAARPGGLGARRRRRDRRRGAPVAERDGVLTVACAAAVWAQELDLMAARADRAA